MDRDFKLDMTLNHDPEPPAEGPNECIMCREEIKFDYYELEVVDPINQAIVFDGPCFEQVLAIGTKMYMQMQADEVEYKN